MCRCVISGRWWCYMRYMRCGHAMPAWVKRNLRSQALWRGPALCTSINTTPHLKVNTLYNDSSHFLTRLFTHNTFVLVCKTFVLITKLISLCIPGHSECPRHRSQACNTAMVRDTDLPTHTITCGITVHQLFFAFWNKSEITIHLKNIRLYLALLS